MKKVLENFNLKIKKGQTIALVGETGSGKSTIVNLIYFVILPFPLSSAIFTHILELDDLRDFSYELGTLILIIVVVNIVSTKMSQLKIVLFILELCLLICIFLILDPYRSEKAEMAMRLNISPEDIRIDNAFNELNKFIRKDIKTPENLNEMLEKEAERWKK